jgi:hypothetical protein
MRLMSMLTCAGLGAGVMYLMDPQLGRRRRALLRDQIGGGARQLGDTIEKSWRDAQQRAQGVRATVQGALREEFVPDDRLRRRTRSVMGRYVSNPGAIEVRAEQGRVTLRGPVLADEVERLVSAVRRTRGVRTVDNQLEVRSEPGNIAALQGTAARRQRQTGLMSNAWNPTTWLGATLASVLVMVYGAVNRVPAACALGTAGSLMLLGAAATRQGMPGALGQAESAGGGQGQRAAPGAARFQEQTSPASPLPNVPESPATQPPF